MASAPKTLQQEFDISISNQSITIRTKKTWNRTTIFIGVLVGIPAILLSPLVPLFIFIFLAMVVLVVQSNSSAVYPLSILDFKSKTLTKFPGLPIFKEKKLRFNKVYDVAYLVKSVGGYASAYEDENTDYRKTIVIETDKGDIKIAKYYSRNEEMEEDVKSFADQIRDNLIATTAT